MTNREPVAWVLNLDAEDELAHAGAHTPTAAMAERIEGLVPRLAGLIHPGDQLIWPSAHPVDARLLGRAWCPTRWALTQMERAGVRLPRAPSMELLRRVNHRRFAHALGQALPAAGYAQSAEELATLLGDHAGLERSSEERCWLIKRPLGFAGRGRKKLRAGEISAADQSWLDASLRTGDGLQVEPWVAREMDCALHGWLGEDGRCVLGRPTVQLLDATGAWQSSALAEPDSLTPEELAALTHEAQRTADALRAEGYFGPFGLDAYRWRAPGGARHFQPRSELNARYSMGWATGMAEAQALLG